MNLKHSIAKGQPVCWNDVEVDECLQAVQVQREMGAAFA